MSISLKTVDQSEIDCIEPLWQKLIEHHRLRSRRFKNYYREARFENRKSELLRKGSASPLNIELAFESGRLIGYCVSSIDAEKTGEIDSILVKESCRGQGTGDTLMRHACRWMDAAGVKRKVISVGEGNEEVLAFYARYGFYPLAMTMVQTAAASIQDLSLPDNLTVVQGRSTELELIGPLWGKLTRYDAAVTPRFKDHFEKRDFNRRMQSVRDLDFGERVNLDLVRRKDSNRLGGYCLSSISPDKNGKIESFYLEPELRGRGGGSFLMKKALDWLESRQAVKKSLMTAAGNTRAIAFYSHFGFYPRSTVLQQATP
jgi:diamine N-acetyltransferase